MLSSDQHCVCCSKMGFSISRVKNQKKGNINATWEKEMKSKALDNDSNEVRQNQRGCLEQLIKRKSRTYVCPQFLVDSLYSCLNYVQFDGGLLRNLMHHRIVTPCPNSEA